MISFHSLLLLSVSVYSTLLLRMIIYKWVVISHLDLRQETNVEVAPITFAMLILYEGRIIKLRGDILTIILCKQQIQQWGGWIGKSNMVIECMHLQICNIPIYWLLRDHFATFSTSASSLSKKQCENLVVWELKNSSFDATCDPMLSSCDSQRT